MNIRLKKFLAITLSLTMAISMFGCSKETDTKKKTTVTKASKETEEETEEETDESEEPEETTEDTEDTEDTTETTVATTAPTTDGLVEIDASLTYPDHVATYDEVHPFHEPGDVTGEEASLLLDSIEQDMLAYALTSYVDIELTFENPENYGIYAENVTWGEVTSDTDYDKMFYENILDQLLTINYLELDTDDKLFYDKILFDVEESLYGLQYTAFEYYTTAFNPLTGPQCDLLFILAVFDFETVEDAENYILLIEDIDRYYDEICEFEEQRAEYGFANSPSIYQQIAESFDAIVDQEDDCFLYDSFEERLDNIDGITDDQKEELIAAHEAAMHDVFFPEMQECSDRMGALAAYDGYDYGMCQFPGGEAYYEYMYRNQTNASFGTDKGILDIESTMSDWTTNLWIIILSGDVDFDVYTNPNYSMGDMDANLEFLAEAIKEDFPELPEHSYFTMDVPESMEENFSPAAYLGYHLDNFDSNMIITNLSNVDGDFGITCAHEGYPGHMFQSVYTRSVCNHPYMYIFDSIGYNEGWTTYIEGYCYKYFTDDMNTATLVQFDGVLNLMLMARMDIGIHKENWTVEDCADWANEQLSTLGMNLTADDLQSTYDLLVNVPNYATKYGIGYLNTTATMDALHEAYPDATDKEVFTSYLNALPGTYEQILDQAMITLGEG